MSLLKLYHEIFLPGRSVSDMDDSYGHWMLLGSLFFSASFFMPILFLLGIKSWPDLLAVGIMIFCLFGGWFLFLYLLPKFRMGIGFAGAAVLGFFFFTISTCTWAEPLVSENPENMLPFYIGAAITLGITAVILLVQIVKVIKPRFKPHTFASIMPLLLILLLVSCAGPNPSINTPDIGGDIAGFFSGLWHGMIAAFAFIASLFWDSVHFYEVHNNGGWYNFGFALGAGFFLAGEEKTRNGLKKKRRKIVG